MQYRWVNVMWHFWAIYASCFSPRVFLCCQARCHAYRVMDWGCLWFIDDVVYLPFLLTVIERPRFCLHPALVLAPFVTTFSYRSFQTRLSIKDSQSTIHCRLTALRLSEAVQSIVWNICSSDHNQRRNWDSWSHHQRCTRKGERLLLRNTLFSISKATSH